MAVILCTPTYKRFDTLSNLIDSVCASQQKPDVVAVVDNSAGAMPLETFRDRLAEVGVDYKILSQSHNIGVAAAWNLCYTTFAKTLDDKLIICNDDIVLDPYAIYNLLTAAHRYRHFGFFYGASGGGANAFSMFYLPTEVYRLIGAFDKQFYPAYFEDNDYSYRLRLAGFPMVIVPECQYSHVGSATLAAYTPGERAAHDAAFNKNATYYAQKWGGAPGSERFQYPFNAAPNVLTGRIQ